MDDFFVIPAKVGIQFYLISWAPAEVYPRGGGGGSDMWKSCGKLVIWLDQVNHRELSS